MAKYAMTRRELRVDWMNGKLKIEGPTKGSPAPAGTIVKLPEGQDEERILGDGGLMRDLIVLDEETARELMFAQRSQQAAYDQEVARLKREKDAALRAEEERQARRDALRSLALSAVPVPPELDNG